MTLSQASVNFMSRLIVVHIIFWWCSTCLQTSAVCGDWAFSSVSVWKFSNCLKIITIVQQLLHAGWHLLCTQLHDRFPLKTFVRCEPVCVSSLWLHQCALFWKQFGRLLMVFFQTMGNTGKRGRPTIRRIKEGGNVKIESTSIGAW